jgi:LysM repeat protein
MAAAMDPRADSERPPANWTARILAPVALAVAALVIVLVVSGSLSDDGDGGKRRDRGEPTATGCTPSDPQARSDGYYVVKPGEPGLSSVADKTCVPVDQLQQLNPDLDPQAIPVGGCVDLRPDGCKALAEG